MTDGPWVGADIGGTKLLLAVAGATRRELHRVPTGPNTGPAEIRREIGDFVNRLGARPAALGIAVPGLVGADGRIAACDVLPRLVGWNPAEDFAETGCPVRVLNDAEAALAEEAQDLALNATAGIVMAGTAVGAAFRIHGVPLRGARGWAGELGYLPIALPESGNVIRLDELAGGAAIARRLRTDGAGVSALAARNGSTALAVIRDAGAALGLGLAAVVNLLNPELLVLSGGALTLPGYRDATLKSAERHSVPELWRVCTVRMARAGEAVAALGAAREAARQAISSPQAGTDR